MTLTNKEWVAVFEALTNEEQEHKRLGALAFHQNKIADANFHREQMNLLASANRKLWNSPQHEESKLRGD